MNDNVIILSTVGAPTLRGHCSHHVPQAVVMRQHTMPLFWRMLHRAATSCTRQAARSKRSKRSEPSACPIPPCIPPARAATALPIIPSAWSGPVHLSHTATRSRRSQASASQYPVSCRFPADSCFTRSAPHDPLCAGCRSDISELPAPSTSLLSRSQHIPPVSLPAHPSFSLTHNPCTSQARIRRDAAKTPPPPCRVV